MMVRGQYAKLMATGLDNLFVHFLNLQQKDEEYTHIFNMETSDSAYETESEFGDMGSMPEKPEGEAVTYQDIPQGGDVRYTNFTYGLGCRTSFELIDDDKYGLIKQVPKALARSAHFQKEMTSWNVLNLGFTTQKTIDGVTLFNTQHPLLGGPSATALAPGISGIIAAAGTYPNRPTVDIDLSMTALQDAINIYEGSITASGLPTVIKPKLLVIHWTQKWIARELLGSAHKPYTSDNEINAILNEELNYFVSHYLTSSTAWFLLSSKDTHTMKHKTRMNLQEKFSDDFDTQSLKTLSIMRFGVGVTSHYGTYGSNGP